MRDAGCLDDLYLLGSKHVRTEIVEETSPASEEDRYEREQQLVKVPGCQILLDG
ncbi:MAG TPA: hypothetical protein VHI55_12300 [Gaiellaceae bacterium]|nr:hypothetical protein [Gaiellaceae bacterium]